MSRFPSIWGHRGASADFPENTLASFESAARAGSDGIESDVHISADDVIVMFHDHDLGRTTIGGTGAIQTQKYHGNIEKLTTVKSPSQKIPTFDETMAWFNRPENQHLVLNIDVKPGNDPDRLFRLMRAVLERTAGDWETSIAPRLILGLWHPKFVQPALSLLPKLKRCLISIDVGYAQHPIWWENMHAFSIGFPFLATGNGQAFIKRCKKEGKEVYTWTLNFQEQWAMSSQWGVDVIMTDKPIECIAIKRQAEESKAVTQPKDPWFLWKDWRYYSVSLWMFRMGLFSRLERFGGPIAPFLTSRTGVNP